VTLAVLGRLQATPYVSKGGIAGACADGLEKHSTILDFDPEGPAETRDLVEAKLDDLEQC
jgi:hypothetical protein